MTNQPRPERDHEAVARRAYELFEQRGSEHGHEEEDWRQAEAEIYGDSETRGEDSPPREAQS